MRIGEWNLHATPDPRTYGYIRWRRASTHSDFCFGASLFPSEKKKKKKEEAKVIVIIIFSLPLQRGTSLECTVVPWFFPGQRAKRANFSAYAVVFLTPSDGHDRCLTCLGHEHAEMAFVDGSCPHCERMSMAALRLPSVPSRPGASGSTSSAATLVRKKGNLMVTVRNAPTGQPPRKSNKGVMQELRMATDFDLQVTKVMATMVVQVRHLWLNLA
ncbi:hypothetical protein M9458_005316 [Cirrhinus mrigala]|uniref:Uncharacterized protein n=1 Tax=Cirrhinus mrigala TaxID=683832 RepID=A0ABD0REI1_CIRMR